MSSNFNFYVNRQGVQGKRGAKGEQGFSPVISVESQTANEYILKVENEDGSFTTPNLRGNAIENNGGTYIRFNPDTEQMYTGYADGATTEQAGVVRMGTYDDLVAGESEELVPNVADVHDYVQNSIGSIGGVVTTEQFNTYTSETAITLDNLENNKLDKSTFDSYTSATNSTLESLSTNKVNVSDYTTFANNTNSALSDLSTNKVETSAFDSYVNSTSSTLNTLETEKLDFTDLSNSLIEGANVTLTKNTENKTITISSSGSAQVQANWTETDSSNPSFIQNKPTLGTMASEDASNYTPTAGLSDVAISGSYNDLLNKPTIPEAQVNADWNATSGVSQILNKPTLFSGDYNDLTNKPDIPAAANNGTITITQGGVTKGSFTTDQATDATIDIDAGASITVDSAIDSNSENPVQNKVIASALDKKQDKFDANIPLSMSQEIISPATNASGTGYYYYYNDTNGYNAAPYIRSIYSSGDSSDYRHDSTIPFEFDVIYRLNGVTGSNSLKAGEPLSNFYAFGKYIESLNKVVPYMMLPIVKFNAGTPNQQAFGKLPHDSTGEVITGNIEYITCSITSTTWTLDHVYMQKKLIDNKVVLYIAGFYRNPNGNNSRRIFTISDASGSTDFTDMMLANCNNIILMTDNMMSVIGAKYSNPLADLPNITSESDLGTADSSLFINEPILGNINLDLNYDNSTIKVNASNQIYVDQSALTSKQDTLVSGSNIKTINGTSVLGSGDITTGNVSSSTVNNIVQITQADYNALATKDANTQYIITDAPALALADLSNISEEGINLIKNNSSGRNIGEIFSALLPVTDAGVHLLDGTLLQYGTYKEFIDYIAALYGDGTSIHSYFCTESEWQQSVTTYGVCGKFVYDSTNNTVRLPKVTGKIDGTTDLNTLGDLEPLFVRLPNITGWFYSSCDNTNTSSGGAFSTVSTGSYSRGPGNYATQWAQRTFNASSSSSVYSGNGSDTAIHEQAIKCFIYIVIATSSKTEIQTNIDEITTDLNGKADVDLTNTTDQAKILMGGMAMPSNKYIDLTLGADGSTYTAPANGWFVVSKRSTGANQVLALFLTSTRLGFKYASTGTQGCFVSCPVKKGDEIVCGYTTNGTTEFFRFIYAVGSESEVQ